MGDLADEVAQIEAKNLVKLTLLRVYLIEAIDTEALRGTVR